MPMTPAPPAADSSLLPFPLQLEAFSVADFSDDSSNGPSGTLVKYGVSLPFFAPLSDSWTTMGALRAERAEYDTMPFRDDGLDVWKMGGLIAFTHDVNDTWDVTFGGLGSIGFEDGSSIRSDSVTGGGFLGAGYKWSKNVKTTLGALYLTRINEDALAIPFIGLEWRVSDALEINIRGLEGAANWKISDEWTAFFHAEYDPLSGTLERHRGQVADSFEDETARAGLGLTWSPSPGWAITAHGGVAFHDTGLRDDRERVLSTERLDPAPYAAVKVSARF